MSVQDEIAAANERHWEKMVREGCGYTIPWLDLDVVLLRQYAQGQVQPVPEMLTDVYPPDVLADVEGKEVLCLGAGGGQQSAVFGLLGARVTVVDLAEGQLVGDRKAAAHYGYEVTTIHADMRNLSCLDDNSFDLVYGTGMAYIPAMCARSMRVLPECYEPAGCTEWISAIRQCISWTGTERRIASLSRMRRDSIDAMMAPLTSGII